MSKTEPAPPPARLSDAERRSLLSHKLSELPLAIGGTQVGALIDRLYAELDTAGIAFRPKIYLSDEWGCPNKSPIIGIPFYLTDSGLSRLVAETTGSPSESSRDMMMYLRHEAGHAFNYAYRLYAEPEWQRIFGPFSRPYRERYRTAPFSTRFIRHIPGWYAQKHPDEDFAESFAVWLTPDSAWRQRYVNTQALAKLEYVDRAASRCGRKQPPVSNEDPDRPVSELNITVGEWCKMSERDRGETINLPGIINEDLRRAFPASEGRLAADCWRPLRQQLVRDVHDWTGLDIGLSGLLFDELLRRAQALDLKVEDGESPFAMRLAIFMTTLAMNYQKTGRFVEG